MHFSVVTAFRRLMERLRRHPSGEALVQFVDGELPEGLRRDIEAHLENCEECRFSVEEFDDVLSGTGALAANSVPDHVLVGTLQSILAAIGVSVSSDPQWTAEGLRDLALCVGPDEALATRRRESPELAIPRLAVLIGTPAARALAARNRPYP